MLFDEDEKHFLLNAFWDQLERTEDNKAGVYVSKLVGLPVQDLEGGYITEFKEFVVL